MQKLHLNFENIAIAGGVVYAVRSLMEKWNDGKMEYWVRKVDNVQPLFNTPWH